MNFIDLKLNDGIDSSVNFNVDFECKFDTTLGEIKNLFEEKFKFLKEQQQQQHTEQEINKKIQKKEKGEMVTVSMNTSDASESPDETIKVDIIGNLRQSLLNLSLSFNEQLVDTISREEYLNNQIKDCSNLLSQMLSLFNDSNEKDSKSIKSSEYLSKVNIMY
jgi:hypothetical protein